MENVKIVLAKAVVRMLQPLVHILLKNEVSHSEFAELAKRAFVDVAYNDFSIPNRKQTYSRVAVITGLSRKEVVRLTKVREDEAPVTKGPLNRAARVIAGWLSDPDFLDENNEPRPLPLRDDVYSFEELVSRYSGDITGRAVLDELIRVGAAQKLDKTTVQLTHHGYVPDQSISEKIQVVAQCTSALLSTAVHNLECAQEDARFQRQVGYGELPESVIKEFKQYSHDKSLELLLDLNRWLINKKKNVKPKPNEPTGRVGLGIYYFEVDKENKG